MQITFKEFCFKFGGKHNINAIVRPLECAIAEVFCMSGSRAILCSFVAVKKSYCMKMKPWKFCSGFSLQRCLQFSPINHNSITQLEKVCLSYGVEILCDADNFFKPRSMQKWLEYRVSNFTESSWKPCRLSNTLHLTLHYHYKFCLDFSIRISLRLQNALK